MPKSYSGIAAINKSVRDNKNVLEVRLEKNETARFNLSNVEIEGLLRKLGIDSTHFLGVSACPDISHFTHLSTLTGLSIRMSLIY